MNNYDEELNSVIKDYSKLLFKISLDLVRNKEESENIVQESFLSYYKKIKEYSVLDDTSKRRLLARICINKSKDYLKSSRYKTNDDSFKEEDFNNVKSNYILEESLIKKEKNERIIKAINELKNPYKDLITFYYINDLTLDEMALHFNSKKETIKVQLTRGKNLLREMIDKGGGLDG